MWRSQSSVPYIDGRAQPENVQEQGAEKDILAV